MAHGDIDRKYGSIFEKDPLLLEGGSQQQYSEAMLKHLLLERSMNSFQPTPVDLFSSEDRLQFVRRARRAPNSPSADVIQMYKQKKAARETLSNEEKSELRKVTMACDGEYTANRIEKYRLQRDVRNDRKHDQYPFDRRLRIAAIGYRVGISQLDGQCNFDEELCLLDRSEMGTCTAIASEFTGCSDLGRTIKSGFDRVRAWKAAILQHVRSALDHHCHFIVLPEFALPPSQENECSIEDELCEICGQSDIADHFVFAGSRHEGTSNRGLVLMRQEGKVSEPWWHHKVASARGLGENVLGPYGIKRPSYTARFQVGPKEFPVFPTDIAICYDTFDPTVFLNLILQSFASSDSQVRPRILLVPSFNTSTDFVALLRDLSFLSRSVVVYVNGLHGDTKLFIGGFDVADFTSAERLSGIRGVLLNKAADLANTRNDILLKCPVEPDQAQQIDQLEKQENAARLLELSLGDLSKAGALEDIITIEGRPSPDINAKYDPSDVLYYNIDMGLVSALLTFRAKYFASDLFLPRPFQWEQLKAAAEQIKWKRMKAS